MRITRYYDYIIVGGGIAGLSAATAIADKSNSIAVIEKSAAWGGTARFAYGSIYVPNNHLAKKKGIHHRIDDEIKFLASECYEEFDSEQPFFGIGQHNYQRIKTYVIMGEKVISDLDKRNIHNFSQQEYFIKKFFFSRQDSIEAIKKAGKVKETHFQLDVASTTSWDYHWQNNFNTIPFGKHLWASFDLSGTIKYVLSKFFLNWQNLFKNYRSITTFTSFLDQLSKLPTKFGGLGNGFILGERFVRYLRKKNTPMFLQHRLINIQFSGKRVEHITVETKNGAIEVWGIGKALILASGCYSQDSILRQQYTDYPIKSACPMPSNTGDLIHILSSENVQMDLSPSPLLCQNIMQVAIEKKGISHEPVFFIWGGSAFIVNRYGNRVVNEKLNYQDRSIIHTQSADNEYLFLISDKKYKERNWGFGMGIPIEQKFLIEADNPQQLMLKIQEEFNKYKVSFSLNEHFDTTLEKTIQQFNNYAIAGEDPDFGRGDNAYDVLGFLKADKDHHYPSRTMAPLQGKKIYALIYCLSTFSSHGGLVCDKYSRILTKEDECYSNFYAVGTSAKSILNGKYPSHGLSIGPSLIFGYLAGLHATENMKQLISPRSQLIDSSMAINGAQFELIIDNFKQQLKDAKIKPNAHIALIHESNIQWLALFIALVRLDAVIIPMDNNLSNEDLINKIRFADIDYVISDIDLLEDNIKLLPMPQLEQLGIKLYKCPTNAKEISSDLMMVFSSGTGGKEKLIRLSDDAVHQVVQFYMEQFKQKNVSTILSILPLTAIYTLAFNLACLFSGKSIVFSSPSSPDLLTKLTQYQIDLIPSVPILIEKIHKNIWMNIASQGQSKLRRVQRIKKLCFIVRKLTGINVGKYIFKKIHLLFGSQFKGFICGGATLNQSIAEDMFAFGFSLYEGYGLTETCGVLTLRNNEPNSFGTVGKPIQDVLIKLSTDTENINEILVKTSRLMQGYYKEQEFTQQAISDGWFATGDVGRFDAYGNLVITGRLKEIIVKADEKKYFPSSIEAKYNDIAGISELAVIGIPSPQHSGDIVVLYIVSENEGEKVRIESEAHSRSNELEYAFKVDYIIFGDTIPKNKLGKTCRAILAKEIQVGKR